MAVTEISAQTFPALWKQVREATDKDKPQTAVELLETISAKAEADGSYGDLFASLFMQIQKKAEISSDSIAPATQRLLAKEKTLRESGKTVTACVLRTAIYTQRGFITDKELRKLADAMKPDVDSLLASADAAEYTKPNMQSGFMPLVEIELGSKYFNNDLLSLIAMETNQHAALRRHYEKVKNAQAVAILDVLKYPEREFKDTKSRVEWLDSMIAKWGKWEGVNELRNERQRLSYPMFASDVSPMLCHSFENRCIYFHDVRNIKSITVTITPDGQKKPMVWTKNFGRHADYDIFRDSLEIGSLPVGTYTVSMTSNPKTENSEKMKLYVSDLMVMSQAMPGNVVRYVVVNAQDGNPVPKAKLHFVSEMDEKKTFEADTDENGEYRENDPERNQFKVYATTGKDKSMRAAAMQNWYTYHASQKERKLCNVYPARKLYRPGQTVEVAVMAYSVINGTEMKVRPNTEVTLRLLDPKHKAIETKKLKSDEYGMCNTTFTLPEVCTNGIYVLTAGDGTGSVRVEEYVRPTFDVSIEKPAVAYRDGDTLTVKGTAKMYSGVAVGGARVVYNVVRRNALWWMPYVYYRKGMGMPMAESTVLLSDTVMTEADGTFRMRMPMVLEKAENQRYVRFMNIEAEATVTDVAGESHSAVLSLSLGDRESCLSTNLPERILADSAMNMTVRRFNNAGTDIDGKVAISIDGNQIGTFDANKEMQLPGTLLSGSHKLVAICERDTLERDFVVFRITDKHPVVKTHDWFYQSAETFPENGGDVAIQYGCSDRNGYAIYSIFKENKVIERGCEKMDSSLVTRHLTYKEEYGDGVLFTVAWVRDGVMYTHQAKIRRPLPSKTLKVEWGTFRNLVEPGNKETWTLRITNPDGTPAKSALTATLFDKSLDAIHKLTWEMVDARYVNLPITSWTTPSYFGRVAFFGNDFSKVNTFKALNFSRFSVEFVPDVAIAYSHSTKGLVVGRAAKNSVMMVRGMASAKAVAEESMDMAEAPAMLQGATDDNAGENAQTEVSARENLSETAAFFPCVVNDENGIATLSFTLPESVTTWRFISVAHDKDMRFGVMEDEIVAQKKLMVQPRVPRFLRETDTTVIPATVANLSDNDITAKATMTIIDQKTEQVRARIYNNVTVKAGETAVTEFPLDASKYGEGTLIVRVTVEAQAEKGSAKGFTDGEQHLLPILSSKEDVVNTMPLIITSKGTTTVNVADMLPSDVKEGVLSVEYTDSPAWLLLKSLPFIKGSVDDNAITLVTAFYSNTLAAKMLNSNPDSKSLLTSEDGEKATLYDGAAMDLRARDFYSRLSQMQQPDGSWGWWRGMRGNRSITVEVVKTLLRLNRMVGLQRNTVTMLNRAYAYLDNEVEQDIKEMKKAKQKGGELWFSDWLLDYLYCQTLSSRQKNVDYLLDVMQKTITGKGSRYTDMATKAEATVVLALQGKTKEAADQVESIVQHTVYREDIGRYFDSYRAGYSWFDYRIPTQVSAVEALIVAAPERAKEAREMQRWLLSSKRTQSWDTPINAVNATYAFFGGDASTLKPGTPAKFALDGKAMEQTSDAKSNKNVANTGYTSAETAVSRSTKKLTISKSTDTESWASVAVKFRQEQQNIAASESGFSVTRTIALRSANGKDTVGEASDKVTCKTGDRVVVTITIKADRDYDFVTVTDNRAACLEPINQLSGYHNGAYTVQHDTSAEYCYDMFRKGTHTIKTEYYVTRPGTYTAGTIDVKCTYAPEFTGRSKAEKVEVAK